MYGRQPSGKCLNLLYERICKDPFTLTLGSVGHVDSFEVTIQNGDK